MKNARLFSALGAYLVLGLLAWLLLKGIARGAVLFLLGGLALKTVIAHKAGWGPE